MQSTLLQTNIMKKQHNLFICGTPLQSIIASRIIESEGLDRKYCSLFFYAPRHSPKYEHYYKEISFKVADSTKYYTGKNLVRDLWCAREILKKKQYQNIYFAAATSRYTILALGLARHVQIYTFDDGTGNISSSSIFAKDHTTPALQSLAMFTLSRGYTLDKIRSETTAHYTIYPEFRNNISSQLIPINLFQSKPNSAHVRKCSVILGTVFDKRYSEARVEEIDRTLTLYASKLTQEETYYIPHPKGAHQVIDCCKFVDTFKIAEHFIIDLLTEFAEINLYGFGSSAQINLRNVESVNNHFFKIKENSPFIEEICSDYPIGNIRRAKIIDLDCG